MRQQQQQTSFTQTVSPSNPNSIVYNSSSQANKQSLESLKFEYNKLKEEFTQLQLETQENTVIQSMKDMKETYTQLEAKYDILYEQYDNLKRSFEETLEEKEKTKMNLYNSGQKLQKTTNLYKTLREIINLSSKKSEYMLFFVNNTLSQRDTTTKEELFIDLSYYKRHLISLNSYFDTMNDLNIEFEDS